MVITHDDDWSSVVFQASRTIVFLYNPLHVPPCSMILCWIHSKSLKIFWPLGTFVNRMVRLSPMSQDLSLYYLLKVSFSWNRREYRMRYWKVLFLCTVFKVAAFFPMRFHPKCSISPLLSPLPATVSEVIMANLVDTQIPFDQVRNYDHDSYTYLLSEAGSDGSHA